MLFLKTEDFANGMVILLGVYTVLFETGDESFIVMTSFSVSGGAMKA